MTGTQTLILRAALAIVAGAAGIAFISSSFLQSIPLREFNRYVTAAFVGSRIAIFAGLFLILHVAPRGDIPSFYMDQAEQVLRGLAPYRDFVSSYAPLHPYFDAALIHLWHTPLAMILFAIVVECLTVPLGLYLGLLLVPEQQLRKAGLLYLTSVISIQFVSIDGHDDVILAALMVLSILWLHRNRNFLSGAAIGLGAVLTKFLPLVYAPMFFVSSVRRWRWAAGLALPVVLVYGAFVIRHLDVLSVLSNEGALKSANNITFLIEALVGITVPLIVWDGLMLISLILIFARVTRAVFQAPPEQRLHPVTFGTAALTLTIELLARKSWPPYLVIALFPICLLVAAGSGLDIALFAVFGVVAVVAPSYWATVLGQFSAEDLHRGLLAGQPNCYILLVLQTALISGYVWLLTGSLRRITASQNTAHLDHHAAALRD